MRIFDDSYEAVVNPTQGGAMCSLKWRGEDILRPQTRPGVLNSAYFPLVPFSNRIAESAFCWRGRKIVLKPNHPMRDDEPVLHGFGWLNAWDLVDATQSRAVLRTSEKPDGWPWPFQCIQTFELGPEGLEMELSVTNQGREAMPVGLGFHPFFPMNKATRYRGLHRGEWQVGRDRMPHKLRRASNAQDWWSGNPVATRAVDTVYSEREGPLRVIWPDRDVQVTVVPSPNLSFTAVYVPPDADFFCVEPVSHATDAFNRPGETGVKPLAPGDSLSVSMTLTACRLQIDE